MVRKTKKLTAVILAVVMCMSIFVLPSFATETTTTNQVFSNIINKTATPLADDDTTDVTLSVPGGEMDYSSDIVMIIGRGPSSDYDYLIETIKKMLIATDGTSTEIKLGLVTFSDTTEEETILPLTVMKETDPNNEAEDDMDYIIAQACQKTYNNYSGINLESALVTARDMLAADTSVPADRKHLIVVSTGLTYWFDDVNGEPATIAGTHNEKGNYMTGNKYWLYARNGRTNTNYGYEIPSTFIVTDDNGTKNYVASWKNYWNNIVEWVEADQNNYVFAPVEKDYSDFWANNHTEIKYWGYAISTAENIEIAKDVAVPKFKGAANPTTTANAKHALNYERAQYDAWVVYNQMQTPVGESFNTVFKDDNGNYISVDGLGYNCYAIANGMSSNPGEEDIWLESNQIGYNFMRMLGGDNCVNWRDHNDFFEPIENKILYTCSDGSTVTDYIGYDETEGNFEFVTDADTLKLVFDGVEYNAEMTDSKADENGKIIESSYAFKAEGSDKVSFELDYKYGNGTTEEHFVWTFHENVSLEAKLSLTYKLKLIDKSKEAGTHIVDTNIVAYLDPIDSTGKPGAREFFPVPNVEYEVVPYDVDIVLALGAGIAKYDIDYTYTHTYDSIVSLVEPLVTQGINVKLGLVAVEHYDDVAMELTALTKDNYKDIIQGGLEIIQKMPAGPTNLHGNIVAAKAMLDADTSVPAENKFFHVIATGRTYNYDNEEGVPTTIINKVALKGSTYYYWGHYLWQSQRGGHTSLYMIPARYNNDFSAYWADVEKWVEADGDTYAYSFTEAYDTTNPEWFNTFFSANSTDAKALKLASSRFGWILNDLTNSGLAGIGSGSNPANALNYERAQYEAYKAYQSMVAAGYNCYAISSETPNYQNDSEYIKQGAKYTGTSTIQLGHSFMNFLAGGEAIELFDYTRDENGNLVSTAVVFATEDYYEKVDVAKLVKSTDMQEAKLPMLSAKPPVKGPQITQQPENVEAELGQPVRITVKAEGDGLSYQWYYKEAKDTEFKVSSIKSATYSVSVTKANNGREIYCVITDKNGNQTTSDTAKIIRVGYEELKIVTQPTNVEAELGQAVKISVKAQGESLKYQWYYKEAKDTEFKVSSIKSSVYSVSMTKSNAGREVYCVITDEFGNQVTSDTAKLIRIGYEELKIITQPTNVEVEIGRAARVTVKAQGESLKYQWYYKEAKGTTFKTSSIKSATYSVTLTKSNTGRQVYCVITDEFGNSVTTDTAVLLCSGN